MPQATKRPSYIEEAIADLGAMADTLEAGGLPELGKRYTVRRVKVPAAPTVTAAEIKAAREAIGASQPVFAGFLGVSAQLVKAWEQGAKTPTGPARRLLADIRTNHAHWQTRLAEAVFPGRVGSSRTRLRKASKLEKSTSAECR